MIKTATNITHDNIAKYNTDPLCLALSAQQAHKQGHAMRWHTAVLLRLMAEILVQRSQLHHSAPRSCHGKRCSQYSNHECIVNTSICQPGSTATDLSNLLNMLSTSLALPLVSNVCFFLSSSRALAFATDLSKHKHTRTHFFAHALALSKLMRAAPSKGTALVPKGSSSNFICAAHYKVKCMTLEIQNAFYQPGLSHWWWLLSPISESAPRA